MKVFVPMTKVVAEVPHVFACGYCELSALGFKPQYYNSGVYGWNCDIIVTEAQDIAVTTGYRGTRGKRIPSVIITGYTKKAEQLKNLFFTNQVKYKILDYETAMKLLRENFWKSLRYYAQTGKIELY